MHAAPDFLQLVSQITLATRVTGALQRDPIEQLKQELSQVF
jgi:hypothetical protein